MTAEYIVKIKGDTSQLEQTLKKVQGNMKKLDDDEVLIKLNYDGNVKQFNKVFDQVLKSCPELSIQFQYDVNKKILDSELEKMQKMTNLEYDINTSNVNKKIKKMIEDLDEAISLDASEAEIKQQIENIYKYANTAKQAGAKIGNDISEQIYNSIEGTDFEDLFEHISDRADRFKLFNLSGSLSDEIDKTKSSIEDLKKYTSDLESKGASPFGNTDSLVQLQNEIRIIKEDITELREQTNADSGKMFSEMSAQIQDLNDKLTETLDRMTRLQNPQEFNLGNTIKKWQNKGLEDVERYTPFNSQTMESLSSELEGEYNHITGKLIRESIEKAKFYVDGFIHSHPEKFAAFSDDDLEVFFKLAESGIVHQVITSFEEAMSLDLSKVDNSKFSEILAKVKEEYANIEQDLSTQFYNNYADQMKQIANLVVDDTLETAPAPYQEIFSNIKERINKLFTDSTVTDFNSYTENVEKIIRTSLTSSSLYQNQSPEGKDKLISQMGKVEDAILGTFENQIYEDTKDVLQQRFQKVLVDVFSDSSFLKEGVTSAIKVESIADFIDFSSIKEAAKDIVDTAKKATEDAQKSHSTSLVAEKLGEYWGEGYAKGILEHKDDVEQAVSTLVKIGELTTKDMLEYMKNILSDDQYSPLVEPIQNVITARQHSLESENEYLSESVANESSRRSVLYDEISRLEEDNSELAQENDNLRRLLTKEAREQDAVARFYNEFGTPSQALDKNVFANYRELLDYLGGSFKEMNDEAEDFSELKLNFKFFEVLTEQLNLSRDELTVIKSDLEQISNLVPGGKWRHLQGDRRSDSEIYDRINHIDEIIKGSHSITQEEVSQAEHLLDLAKESTGQIRNGLNEVTNEIENQSNLIKSKIIETQDKYEELGQGTKRVISDIGLSYDEFIKKVKNDKSLEERFAVFDETGKVIDSFIGKLDRMNLPENMNVANAAKVFHKHSSISPLGGTLSDDDYLTWYDLFLSKGIGKQFELMWREKSVNIDLSNVKSTLISDVVSSLINIAKIAGMQLEDANGNIPIPLSDIYNSLSNGLLKSFVLRNNGNVNTDIIDEYKNEQFGIDNLYRVFEDFSEFRKNNYKNDNAIDNKIEEYKKILLYLKEHTEYTYERVKKALDYEKAIIRDTDSYGLNHNSMMMKNESAEYLGEMLADSYSKVIGSEINSQNFDPFNLSSDAEREYFEITGKYYDAIAEAMDYTIREALKGEISEKDFIKEAMTNIGFEIGSLDSDEIVEGFVSIKDTVENYIKELFNKYKVELPNTPQISDSIIDDSVTQEWVDAREQEEKELKKETEALRSLDDSFTEEEIEKMKKGMRNFVRGAIRIQDLIQSFKVEEDVLYAAFEGKLTPNANSNLSTDLNQATHAEEKLLPMVVDTQQSLEKQNEELERRNAIERAFLQTIGQDRESVQAREAIALIKEKREEQEKLNQVKKEEVTAPSSSTAENVDIKAEKSAEELHKEAKGMTEVKEESEKASTSKKGFAKANAEVLQSIRDSLIGLSDEAELFKTLNNIINKFSGKGSDERISTLANNLTQVRNALSRSVDDSSFISALQKLAEQGENLKDLADVLKASRKQIEKAKDVINDSEELSQEDRDALAYQLSQAEEYAKEQKRILELEKEIEKERERGRKQLESYNKEQEKLVQKAQKTLDNEKKSYGNKADSLGTKLDKEILNGVGKYNKDLIEQWDNLKSQIEQFKINLDSTDLDKAKQKIEELEDDFTSLTSTATKKENKIASEDSLSKLNQKIEEFRAKNTNLGRELSKRLDEVIARKERLLTAGLSGNALEKELKDISNEFLNIKAAADKAGESGKSFGHKIIDSLTSANARFIANYLSIQDMIRYVKTLADTVRDVDSAITELRKVSDASATRLQQNFEQSAKTAKELGSSITDVINQTADWARLGYNVDEAEKLARVTTLFQTVGDNMTAETASEAMISTLKAYSISVDESERIVDQYNEIANNFAIDTAGLADSITRAGAALHAGGNALSESMGLVVAANDSLQDPASVGQMLKTKHCLYAQ